MTPHTASKPDYALYLESAKRAELVEELREEGYMVETDKPVGDVRFDLLATKDGRTKAFELRSVGEWKFDREAFRRLQNKARAEGFEFHIVIVNPPPRVNIEIEDLSQKLKHTMQQAVPGELQSLSDRTEIVEVYDLRFADIHVGNGIIRLSGMGTVEVELNDQIDADIVDFHEDAFPFSFKAVMLADGQLKSVDQLSVDTTTCKS